MVFSFIPTEPSTTNGMSKEISALYSKTITERKDMALLTLQPQG